MEYSFDQLRKVQLQERHQPTLTQLPDDFYDAYQELIQNGEDRLKSQFGLESAKTLENARKALSDVFELRKQKIFFKALRDFQTGRVTSDGLAGKEKELYTGLIKLLSSAVLNPKALPIQGVTVEVLADLPAFVGLDAKAYGPYKTGETVCLNAQQAGLLSKKGVVRVLSS
ncbi:MAG TPA: hypothetical protein VI874_05115 [Candidatus Norongarragalinales archaeon]|nr:hypothetical protein [Candidatus Norongarragalinales archaeon]